MNQGAKNANTEIWRRSVLKELRSISEALSYLTPPDGTPIRVCESHGWSIVKDDDASMCIVGLWLTEPKDPCRIVERRLI